MGWAFLAQKMVKNGSKLCVCPKTIREHLGCLCDFYSLFSRNRITPFLKRPLRRENRWWQAWLLGQDRWPNLQTTHAASGAHPHGTGRCILGWLLQRGWCSSTSITTAKPTLGIPNWIILVVVVVVVVARLHHIEMGNTTPVAKNDNSTLVPVVRIDHLVARLAMKVVTMIGGGHMHSPLGASQVVI